MSLDNLRVNSELLEKQLFWLTRSYDLSKSIELNGDYKEEEFDILETLCARFSRSIDFLVRKAFRSLDDVEFESQGTLIDVVNNAHKRALFEDIQMIRDIKDIRNEITHEYVEDGFKALFTDVMKFTPELIKIINNTLTYIEKYK